MLEELCGGDEDSAVDSVSAGVEQNETTDSNEWVQSLSAANHFHYRVLLLNFSSSHLIQFGIQLGCSLLLGVELNHREHDLWFIT